MEIQEKRKPPLVVLTGPTAVGKTRLSLALAAAVNGEIVSADSMQVYRHMDIGTAKIRPEEMQGIPHHMIDILEPWEPFNVVLFKERCEECIRGIYERGHIPVVTGGTGFYIQALLRDVDFTEEPEDTAYRRELEKLAAEKGAEYLHTLLREADPAAAEEIHTNNIKRTVRALEFHHLTGKRISEHNLRERQKESAYASCYFVLNEERDRLYARIEQRVDEMLVRGLADEVRRLRDMGCRKDMVSMQGLGYKELLAWLEGETTYEEAVEILKRDTRHFAKRQLTWFRRERDVIWVNKEEFDYDEDRMLAFMLDKMKDRSGCTDIPEDPDSKSSLPGGWGGASCE
ncbi:MAG: tRNA (adenosine(37)-N6)-dimethylallyltransferase MiaA [Acetatifactor muris]|nr:tRNA (adenosine(37)-N6)-dimethylallyltransferase MiaA [Acetatifactor muris]